MNKSKVGTTALVHPDLRGAKRVRRGFSNWSVLVLALASSAAIGVIAASLVLAPNVPPDLDAAAPASTFSIVMQEFDDSAPVTVAFIVGEDVHLRTPVGGVVTRDDCVSGASIESGQSPLAVNGDPVVALATAIPLWRSLRSGDRGPDVAALQEELNRLGSGLTVDGVVRWSTLQAVKSLFAPAGAGSTDAAVLLGRILWIPAPEVQMQRCEISVGDQLQAGQSIASSGGAIESVSVTGLGSDLLPGDRLLSVDDVVVPLDADATVSDAASRELLAGARSFVEALHSEATSFPAIVGLVVPVQVAAVPPGAVVGAQGQRGCVVSAGRTMEVTIVGSELGRTYVTFEGQPPSRIEIHPDPTSCD